METENEKIKHINETNKKDVDGRVLELKNRLASKVVQEEARKLWPRGVTPLSARELQGRGGAEGGISMIF